jgi:hypothetical protein
MGSHETLSAWLILLGGTVTSSVAVNLRDLVIVTYRVRG